MKLNIFQCICGTTEYIKQKPKEGNLLKVLRNDDNANFDMAVRRG
jgi:hypothetical protein